jgi:hypothetical protein
VKLETVESSAKGLLPGGKAKCATIERTTILTTTGTKVTMIEEFVIAEGVGLYEWASWRVENDMRVRNWKEYLAPPIMPDPSWYVGLQIYTQTQTST